MRKPLRILIHGDYKAATGYGTVITNLLKYWKEFFNPDPLNPGAKFEVCAINYFGDMYQEDENTIVFSALKTTPLMRMPESRDDHGRHGLLWILNHCNDDDDKPIHIDQWGEEARKQGINESIIETEIKKLRALPQPPVDPEPKGYDIVFFLNDIPVINPIVPLLQEIQRKNKENNWPNFKTIMYFPVDNPMIEPIVSNANYFDLLITYNEYSRQAMLKHKPELKGKLKVIPHGIDLHNYYPMDDFGRKWDRDEFRVEYFGKENADKFIIINLNRNQPRKDIPCTIFAFQEYKKTNPKAFLYLHMNPDDPMGWHLRGVLMHTNLVEGHDYMFPREDKANHGHTVQELNKIYNSCDVYVTTTLGEGWGLGVTEAMACGLPVICPNHTSFTEITGNGMRAYLLENLYPTANLDNVIRQQCDYLEVAEKLHEVQQNIEHNSLLHKQTIADALDYVNTLDWKDIAWKFYEYMKKL